MGKRTEDKELVLRALKNHGLNVDDSSDPNVFWISYKPQELEYEVEIDLNYTFKSILCFSSYIPFKFDEPPKNLYYFLNKINSEINFGKFFYKKEDNEIVYRRIHKYTPGGLVEVDVIIHLKIVYRFQLSYEQEFKDFFNKENISLKEIDEMFVRREKRKELEKRN